MSNHMTPGQLWWRHKQGSTLNDLAELTGLSRYQIHRLIMAERWRSGEVVITEKLLRRMIAQGLTVRQMAERCFCSIGCISKKLKKYKLKTRPAGNPKWVR